MALLLLVFTMACQEQPHVSGFWAVETVSDAQESQRIGLALYEDSTFIYFFRDHEATQWSLFTGRWEFQDKNMQLTGNDKFQLWLKPENNRLKIIHHRRAELQKAEKGVFQRVEGDWLSEEELFLVKGQIVQQGGNFGLRPVEGEVPLDLMPDVGVLSVSDGQTYQVLLALKLLPFALGENKPLFTLEMVLAERSTDFDMETIARQLDTGINSADFADANPYEWFEKTSAERLNETSVPGETTIENKVELPNRDKTAGTAPAKSSKTVEKENVLATAEARKATETLKPAESFTEQGEIEFRVQIFATNRKLNNPAATFPDIQFEYPIVENVAENLFRYSVGSFRSFDEARQYLRTLKANGLKQDAFVVAYRNNERIAITPEMRSRR